MVFCKKITIFYDNHCPNCTRFSLWVRRFDTCRRITIRPLRNPEHTRLFPDIDMEKGLQQMPAFVSGVWVYGYDTLYLIFKKLPVFWIVLPVFWLLKITGLGRLLYQQLAVRRKIIPIHCDKTICTMD